MENLIINKSAEFPAVHFDHESGKLQLSGKSYMEDSTSFYKPVLKWLTAYQKQPNKKTEFTFSLEYMNTASSKYVLDIFQVINDIFKAGNEVEVIFKYFAEDEDMEEQGRQYSEIFGLPFTFVAT